MGSLPSSLSRKFNPADYKTAPSWFTGRFLSALNLFTDPVYTNLLNGLTFQQNFNAQFYNLRITGATTNTANFKSAISGSPVGMLMVARNIATDPTIPLTAQINFSWYYNSGVIYITGISGLTTGTLYSFTFLVF